MAEPRRDSEIISQDFEYVEDPDGDGWPMLVHRVTGERFVGRSGRGDWEIESRETESTRAYRQWVPARQAVTPTTIGYTHGLVHPAPMNLSDAWRKEKRRQALQALWENRRQAFLSMRYWP